MRQIVLDTETTGLSPKEGHRIIEIGCVELINREVTRNNFHCYINPDRYVEESAIKVHGLTNEFLRDKPLFAEVAESFLDFIRGAQLIIHNAPFDVGFIDHEFSLLDSLTYNTVDDYCSVLDTLVMAREKHPGQQNSLDALCRRYDVDNANRQLHGALLDAQLLAYVYLNMTGGQTQLFAQEADEATDAQGACHQKVEPVVLAQVNKLVTQYADSDEVVSHQAYLERLRESGSCLWVGQDD